MNFRFLPAFFVVCVLAACGKQSGSLVVPDPVAELPKEIQANVSYCTDARKVMDVYLPAKRGKTTPFIILLHGGAWISGDKKELSVLQDSLCNRGIASVNINYRYASANVHLPQIMDDINEALAFSRNNAAKWALNLEKVAIGGVSSGAHLAMMYAFKFDSSNSVDCVISGAGPTTIDDRHFLNGILLGGGIASVNYMADANYVGADISPKFSEVSPIRNLKNIPLLIIHGESDRVVPHQQSVDMDNEMQSKGYVHQLITLRNTDHDLNLGTPASATRIYAEMARWINTYEK